jgi:hypothetical protein
MPISGFASVGGVSDIRSDPEAFVAAFADRIAAGLLTGAPPRRNRYVVTRREAGSLAFRATDWWTALNVGLNDVELSVSPNRRVRYDVGFRRWMSYGLGFGAVLGSTFIVFFLVYDVRAYLVRHPMSQIPGLSLEQNVAIGWGMAIFWGFAWPWILAAMHKRPLRRLIGRIIAEVDEAALSGPGR